MIIALSSGSSSILAIVSILLGGGFIGALIAIYKARPERDSVVVSSAQNAATILQGLNDALYNDLKRTRRERDFHEERAEKYEAALRISGASIPEIKWPDDDS